MFLQIAMDHTMAGMAAGTMSTGMTHYMELLATNQPWNLIVFMAIPVILAETLTATEFFVAFNRLEAGSLRALNKYVGTALGFYFLGIVLYLAAFVLPGIQWRGPIDVIAVGAYLSGVIFLFGISMQELGAIGRSLGRDQKIRLHFSLLIGFLVVAHVAMIFGMANPALI